MVSFKKQYSTNISKTKKYKLLLTFYLLTTILLLDDDSYRQQNILDDDEIYDFGKYGPYKRRRKSLDPFSEHYSRSNNLFSEDTTNIFYQNNSGFQQQIYSGESQIGEEKIHLFQEQFHSNNGIIPEKDIRGLEKNNSAGLNSPMMIPMQPRQLSVSSFHSEFKPFVLSTKKEKIKEIIGMFQDKRFMRTIFSNIDEYKKSGEDTRDLLRKLEDFVDGNEDFEGTGYLSKIEKFENFLSNYENSEIFIQSSHINSVNLSSIEDEKDLLSAYLFQKLDFHWTSLMHKLLQEKISEEQEENLEEIYKNGEIKINLEDWEEDGRRKYQEGAKNKRFRNPIEQKLNESPENYLKLRIFGPFKVYEINYFISNFFSGFENIDSSLVTELFSNFRKKFFEEGFKREVDCIKFKEKRWEELKEILRIFYKPLPKKEKIHFKDIKKEFFKQKIKERERNEAEREIDPEEIKTLQEKLNQDYENLKSKEEETFYKLIEPKIKDLEKDFKDTISLKHGSSIFEDSRGE